MIIAVADTHAILWYLDGDPRLSADMQRYFQEAARAQNQIAVSSITFVESVFLVERGRISPLEFTQLRLFVQLQTAYVEIPVTIAIADAVSRISREKIPEMPDRVIAATSILLGVPIITADSKIQASGLRFIW